MTETNQVESASPIGGLVPYERGVGLRTVLRGVIKRFLPASLLGFLGVGGILGLPSADHWLSLALSLIGYGSAVAVGFGMGLTALRRWLYPDARVDGRRSFIAGLLSPFLVFIGVTFIGGMTLLELGWVLVLAGVIMALGMFFAWLSPTPEHMRDPTFAGDPQEETREEASPTA